MYPYTRHTIEGDKKTTWMCGCFQTEDDFFKFCPKHGPTLKRAILLQIDELDMTLTEYENLECDNGDKGRDKHDGNGV